MSLQRPTDQPLFLYDLVFATRRPRLTGIERYAINMFCASARRQEGVIAIVADARLLPPGMPVIEAGSFPMGWILLRKQLSAEQMRKGIMICASVPPSPSLLRSRMPMARIIHDDFAWSRSKALSLSGRLLFRDYEALTLKRHDLIFAPTQIARDDLAATLGRDDIGIAGNAPGLDPLGPQQKPPALGSLTNFVLMVGTVEPRKNYEQAARIVRRKLNSDVPFVVAGRRGWQGSGDALESVNASGKLIWLQDADDDELRWLYHHCQQFLSLSHAEGFNMPLVEAGIAGCPILCTDLPIHRAVAPPWARFIPAGADDEVIAQALRKPFPDTVGIESYRTQFSWETVADTVESRLKAIWHERVV